MIAQRAGMTVMLMFVAILLLEADASGAYAAADETYVQRATVVGPGGAPMHGGRWRLDGSIGQAVTGRSDAMSGMSLAAGFWSTQATPTGGNDRIFVNGFDAR